MRASRECIFVRGATEGINLVMHGYGRKFIERDDEIIISAMEHHANIVPWQMLCEEKGALLRVIPMNDAGELLLDEYDGLLNERTKFVAITHVSNALGTINPVKEMIAQAHKYGVPVLIDGAQARRTCLSTCRISIATSTRFPVTRCMRRPEAELFTVKLSCWKK